MSTATLLGLRDYLYGTLSADDMVWLVQELTDYVRKDGVLKPYTTEELHERIARAERDFAEGRYYTDDEVFRDLDEEFDPQEELEKVAV